MVDYITQKNSQGNDSFTFPVDEVEICKTAPTGMMTAEQTLRHVTNSKAEFEDFSHKKNKNTEFLAGQLPGILHALHLCFMSHYPLKLSVSDFIVLIGQGLGRHIDRNAEKLREHFVNHKEKETILVARNDFGIGLGNDWTTVFGDFAEKIKSRVKTDIYDVVIDDTSVATKTTRIVSEVALMDAMKHYFTYRFIVMCGIPKITLEGTPEDWKKLREKVRKLEEMNKGNRLELDWWLKELVPVIEKICETGIHHQVDRAFWSDIYKYQSKTKAYKVTPYVSGWIRIFFPYLIDSVNTFTETQLDAGKIPNQVCDIPFKWVILNKKIPMKFYGGFIGARYHKTGHYIEPVQAWAVSHQEPEQNLKDTKPKMRV